MRICSARSLRNWCWAALVWAACTNWAAGQVPAHVPADTAARAARATDSSARRYPLPIPPSEDYHALGALAGYQPLVSLNGDWQTPERQTYRVPFALPATAPLDIRTRFHLSRVPQQPVWLSVERLPQRTAVYLDGALLYVLPAATQAQRVPLPPARLWDGWHTLRMVQDPPRTAARQTQWMGLPRPLFLVQAGEDSLYRAAAPQRGSVRRAVVYGNAHQFAGALPDSVVRQDFARLRQLGVTALALPDTPSAAVLAQMARAGLRWATRADSLARYRCTEAQQDTSRLPCWVDERGAPVAGWLRFAAAEAPRPRRPDQLVALLLLLPGLLLLVVWRMTDDGSYRLLLRLQHLLGERKQYDLVRGQQLLRGASLLLATVGRFVLLALGITLSVVYLRRYGLGEDLPSAAGWLLRLVYRLPRAPHLLLGWAMVLLVGVVGAQYAVSAVLANIYRRRAVVPRLLGLGVYAAYPWVLVPVLVAFAAVALPAGADAAMPWLLALAWAAYVLVRTLRVVRGLALVLDFQPIAIFLYICGVEIIPMFALLFWSETW